MGQINTNNYPTVDSLADADLLIVENAIHGTGTTTPKQLRENAIGTDALKTTAQTVTGAINEVWETAGALRGSGKVTSGSSSTIDTDIDLGRAPQVGDRILLLVDSKITAPISVTTYNGSTAITTYWGMLDPSLYLNGVCILEFEQGLEPDTCTVKLVKIFEGTIYTEGTGISLNGDKITNTKPQWGDNIVGQSLSSVSSGNLGIYEAHSGYLIITFDCNAQPASDGYWLSLQDNSGSVVIMKAAVLVDPVTGGRYSRNIKKYTTLICEVTNSGSGSSSDPILVNVIGEITNDLADKVDAVLDAISEEKTVSGNPIVITDALPVPATSLETTINAIQDLHGYDKPWAGGASDQMLDESTAEAGTLNQTTGAEEQSTTVKRSDYMPTRGATDIYTYATGGMRYFWYDSSKGYLSNEATTPNNSISVPNDAAYFRVIAINAVWDAAIMVNSGTTAKPYRPYSNICPISGRNSVVVTRSDGDEISEDFTIQLGTTVYGADINWDTGVMDVLTTKCDMGDLSWTYNGTNFVCTDIVNGIASDGVTCRCSCYKAVNNVAYSTDTIADNSICMSTVTADRLYVHNSAYTDATAFKAAVTGQDIEYKLATPTTIQLTPTQLQMLKGYNRVSIEDGTITLTYLANKLDALLALMQTT